MKKIAVFILTLLCVFSFAGCDSNGRQAVPEQSPDIEIICNDPDCTDASHHHEEHEENHHEDHHEEHHN